MRKNIFIKLTIIIIIIIFTVSISIAGLFYLFSGERGFRNLGFAVYYSVPCSGMDVCVGPNSITRVKGISPLFSSEVDRYIAKDNKNIFYANPDLDINIYNFIDAKSFKKLSGAYYEDTSNVYYLNHNSRGLNVIDGADVNTFKVLGGNHLLAKDKNRVYYATGYNKIEILKNAYPNSFELINSRCNDPDAVFAKDSEHVYYNYWMFPKLSPQTFQIIDDTCRYVRDDQSAYHYQIEYGKEAQWVLSNIEVETYKTINSYYAKDKNYVYFIPDNSKLNGADPNDFIVLAEQSIAKSNGNIYCSGKLIKSVDADTFQMLKTSTGGMSRFEKDKNHVYYLCSLLEGSDPNTFRVTGAAVGIGEDANNSYYGAKITPK